MSMGCTSRRDRTLRKKGLQGGVTKIQNMRPVLANSEKVRTDPDYLIPSLRNDEPVRVEGKAKGG